MTENQKAAILGLLWDSLKRDPEHKDRRQTGWGTKTQLGLVACIERIERGSMPDDYKTGAFVNQEVK